MLFKFLRLFLYTVSISINFCWPHPTDTPYIGHTLAYSFGQFFLERKLYLHFHQKFAYKFMQYIGRWYVIIARFAMSYFSVLHPSHFLSSFVRSFVLPLSLFFSFLDTILVLIYISSICTNFVCSGFK